MIVTVFDSESNGYFEDKDPSKSSTKVWCIAVHDKRALDTGNKKGLGYQPFLYTPDRIEEGLEFLERYEVLVGHNIKKHDLPLFKKLYNWEPASHQVIIDTLVFSRMLNPKRPSPEGYKGGKPHSIEAWGHRLGMHKPEHDDWMNWSEEMGHRCMEDARINLAVLEELEREAGVIPNYYEQLKLSKCVEVGIESAGYMLEDGTGRVPS